MSMRTRLFVKDSLFQGKSVSLSEAQAHYVINVLRMKSGEVCKVFNGIDGEWLAILNFTKGKVSLAITELLLSQVHEKPLHFAFAPIKRFTAAEVVTKATELGATVIHPLKMEYSIINSINSEKLEQAAIHAAEQSYRLSVPQISQMKSLNDFISQHTFQPLIFFYEKNINQPQEAPASNSLPCVLIGPEGGFSSKEVTLILAQNNILTINLGNRILKAETAVIASLSVYNTLYNNW